MTETTGKVTADHLRREAYLYQLSELLGRFPRFCREIVVPVGMVPIRVRTGRAARPRGAGCAAAGHLFVPGGLDVLTIGSGRVAEVTAFLTVDLTGFRLPARILP
jgi:hypothetical protein